MKTKLKNIAFIRSGIFAKSRPDASVVYLQAKHFEESGKMIAGITPELIVDRQTENHLLQPGDILFAAKGTKNFASVYKPEYGLCVASSTFLVVTLKNEFRDAVLPEFVAWLMNCDYTMEKLKREARGTSIPSISKLNLEELTVNIPDLQKQGLILNIDELRQQETAIRLKLMKLRELYLQRRLINELKK